MTGRSRHEETPRTATTFNLGYGGSGRDGLNGWLGYILRLKRGKNDKERLVKLTVQHIHNTDETGTYVGVDLS